MHRNTLRKALAIALFVSVAFVSCGPPDYPTLGVPYVSQAGYPSDYCAPACVKMWILYSGYEWAQGYTLDVLYYYMGGTGGGLGVLMEPVAAALNAFTAPGDTYYEPRPCWLGADDEVSAKQACSFDAGVPSLSAVFQGEHLCLIDGGYWHVEFDKYVWESVYVHDPGIQADLHYTAGDWLNTASNWYTAFHSIFSWGATMNWDHALSAYGEDVLLDGFPELEYES